MYIIDNDFKHNWDASHAICGQQNEFPFKLIDEGMKLCTRR